MDSVPPISTGTDRYRATLPVMHTPAPTATLAPILTDRDTGTDRPHRLNGELFTDWILRALDWHWHRHQHRPLTDR